MTRASSQHYFLAEPVGGEFGTGAGPEMDSPAESESGSYKAMWLPPERYDEVRPAPIAAALSAAPDPRRLLEDWLRTPVALDEPR